MLKGEAESASPLLRCGKGPFKTHQFEAKSGHFRCEKGHFCLDIAIPVECIRIVLPRKLQGLKPFEDVEALLARLKVMP
jgi:hypothetical protein